MKAELARFRFGTRHNFSTPSDLNSFANSNNVDPPKWPDIPNSPDQLEWSAVGLGGPSRVSSFLSLLNIDNQAARFSSSFGRRWPSSISQRRSRRPAARSPLARVRLTERPSTWTATNKKPPNDSRPLRAARLGPAAAILFVTQFDDGTKPN